MPSTRMREWSVSASHIAALCGGPWHRRGNPGTRALWLWQAQGFVWREGARPAAGRSPQRPCRAAAAAAALPAPSPHRRRTPRPPAPALTAGVENVAEVAHRAGAGEKVGAAPKLARARLVAVMSTPGRALGKRGVMQPRP